MKTITEYRIVIEGVRELDAARTGTTGPATEIALETTDRAAARWRFNELRTAIVTNAYMRAGMRATGITLESRVVPAYWEIDEHWAEEMGEVDG